MPEGTVIIRCPRCGHPYPMSPTQMSVFRGRNMGCMACGRPFEVQEPPPLRPQLLFCDDGHCDLVPYLVHASGLTATSEEKDGLGVRLTTRVSSEAGKVTECSRDAVLSTADL